MKYRKGDINDLKHIQELNKKLFIFEKSFTNSFNEDWSFSEKGTAYFKGRLENGIVFVCEDKESIVGYICGVFDTYSYRIPTEMSEIENMFVEVEYRNKGIGKELIRLFTEESKNLGATRIKVGTFVKNRKAIEFYKKSGFTDKEVYLERDLSSNEAHKEVSEETLKAILSSEKDLERGETTDIDEFLSEID